MKCLFIILSLVASTAFAGSFVKSDMGSAEWSLDLSSKMGHITLARVSSGAKGLDLSRDEQIQVSSSIGALASLGTIADGPVRFETADERSQGTVSELVKKKMLEELARLNVEVKNVEVNLGNIDCREKGFLRKRLVCRAEFESAVEAQFK